MFNTGVDDYGRLLNPGDRDSHWTVMTSADESFLTPGFAITQLNNPGWIANGPDSNFISITTTGRNFVAAGSYVYQTTFDLTGLVPSTAAIVGQFAVDDDVTDVLINGASTGIRGSGFSSFTTFAINSGFIAGVNTLEFVVLNDGTSANPHGLRVEMRLGSTAKEQGPANRKSP